MARQAPPAHPCRAVDWLAAGVLATAGVLLVALTFPTGTATRPSAAGLPFGPAVSGSLAAVQPAVVPARDLDGGVVTANRPNPAPTAVDTLMAPTPMASGGDRGRGRPRGSQSAWRPGHDAAGGPRAPPASPHPS
jgi:hypothetical protein